MAQLLSHPGQCQADVAHPLVDRLHCKESLSSRKTGWLGAIARISSSVESAPTPPKNTPTSAFHRRRYARRMSTLSASVTSVARNGSLLPPRPSPPPPSTARVPPPRV